MTVSVEQALLVLDQVPAEYRVLRRFRPRHAYGIADSPKIGLFVDVETTGLNPELDQIIQFAGVRFEFDTAGNIGHVGPSYCGLQDPGFALPSEITELTGITDADLKGRKIDEEQVAVLLDGVVLVIAHNAEFDRRMIEARLRGFNTVAWACSQRDVKWESFGARGAKLDYLLMMLCSEFYDAHTALNDCLAGIHVLAHPRSTIGGECICAPDSMTGDDGCTAHGELFSPFQVLLDNVRQPTHRLFAHGAPFAAKEKLRARRYRWHPDPVKAWAKDLKASELEAERTWLRQEVYGPNGDRSASVKISAFDRYSVRA